MELFDGWEKHLKQWIPAQRQITAVFFCLGWKAPVWPNKNPWTQLWLPSGCFLQEQADWTSWLGQWWGLDWHLQCLNWVTRTCYLKIISCGPESYYYILYHCTTVFMCLEGDRPIFFSLSGKERLVLLRGNQASSRSYLFSGPCCDTVACIQFEAVLSPCRVPVTADILKPFLECPI